MYKINNNKFIKNKLFLNIINLFLEISKEISNHKLSNQIFSTYQQMTILIIKLKENFCIFFKMMIISFI